MINAFIVQLIYKSFQKPYFIKNIWIQIKAYSYFKKYNNKYVTYIDKIKQCNVSIELL